MALPWGVLHGWVERPEKTALAFKLSTVTYPQISGQSAYFPAKPKQHTDHRLHLGRKQCQSDILQAAFRKKGMSKWHFTSYWWKKKKSLLMLLVSDAGKALDLSTNAWAMNASRQSHSSQFCIWDWRGLLPDWHMHKQLDCTLIKEIKLTNMIH